MQKSSFTFILMCIFLSGCSWWQMPDPFAVPRVDDRPEPHPDHLVRLGDRIQLSLDELEESVQEIHWSQDGKDISKRYFLLSAMFENPREPGMVPSEVPIYVQTFLKDFFLNKCERKADSSICTITVDSNFRYGQDAEKTKRFLVLHERSLTPFQHRFMDTNSMAILLKSGKKAAEAMGRPTADYVPYAGLLGKVGDGTANAIKKAFGDQLWLF